jgi:hypothetical protein
VAADGPFHDPRSRSIALTRIVVSDIVGGASEPHLELSGTSDAIRQLASGLREAGELLLTGASGPAGRVTIVRDPDWRLPADLLSQSDAVEGHVSRGADGNFVLALTSTDDGFASFADSIEEATEGFQPGRHLHREHYSPDGELDERFASFVIGVDR